MKCPNIGKYVNCKGELTIKKEDDGSLYYYCPTCGYKHKKECTQNPASVIATRTE